ncbi:MULTISPECIES: radical SAM protein [Zoogloea]|jgi:wyosine [tRNA(Phe)-imidazoG37] synthetase (radical SAM superfamily)|uniref:radical SAM protein n=1 Tax=Zoogloea TaxID=349 RepID=UPI00258AAFCC|nr:MULTISPECIES: radical SAM protein [Zoogloea]MBT9498406.1 radical SAM protein [Zoogloea sp.]MDD2667062.1 radical SAM protein [Zoogloea sp.]MDY0036772.1 radical SAM protein [Zoogloea oleivorans]
MNTLPQMLTVTDHNRGFIDMTYVYPVVSRRAGGVSVGINLNPNNACNWHCAYCQVPGLVRGAAPEIDLELLETELRSFLHALLHGSFMEEHVPVEARVIRDIAFSGNGEPTSSKAFAEIVERVIVMRDAAGLVDVPIRLITNGSLIDRPYVQTALKALAAAGGEVWFKFDAGTAADIQRINGIDVNPETHARRLALCASLCPTWVQTCMFRWDGELPSRELVSNYIAMLELAGLAALKGVHLYGVARPSFQPEAVHLQQLSAHELEAIARQLNEKGLTLTVSP